MAGRRSAVPGLRGSAWLALCVFAPALAGGGETELGRVATTMLPGTWVVLDTNNINPVLQAAGSSGIIFGYTDYIKWDPVTRRLLYVGGDHGDRPKFVSYSEATNTWQELPQQPWMQPTSHGYDHSGLNPATGEFYHRPFGSRIVYRYSPATGQWSALPSIPTSVMDYNNCCVGIDYFPALGGLVYASVGNNSLIVWEEATSQWRPLASGLAMGPYHSFAEYNPVRRVVVFGGGNGSNDVHKVEGNGVVTTLLPAPFDLGIQWGAVFTVDPASGEYVVVRQTGQLYGYDVMSDYWRLLSDSVPVTTTAYGNPIHGVVATPVSTYGVILFVTCNGPANCRVTLYKHTAGTVLFADGFQTGDTSAWSQTFP